MKNSFLTLAITLLASILMSLNGQSLVFGNDINNSQGEQYAKSFDYANQILTVTSAGQIFVHNYAGTTEQLVLDLNVPTEVSAAALQGNLLYTQQVGSDSLRRFNLSISGSMVNATEIVSIAGLDGASDIAILSDGNIAFAGIINGVEGIRLRQSNGTWVWDYTPPASSNDRFEDIIKLDATHLFGGALATTDYDRGLIRIFDNSLNELLRYNLLPCPLGVSFLPDGSIVATSDCPNKIVYLVLVFTNGAMSGAGQYYFQVDNSWDYPVDVAMLPDGSILINNQGNEELLRLLDENEATTLTAAGPTPTTYALNWSVDLANAKQPDWFQIQRSVAGGGYSIMQTIPATGAEAYSQSIAVQPGDENYFRIRSHYDVDDSDEFSGTAIIFDSGNTAFEVTFLHLK